MPENNNPKPSAENLERDEISNNGEERFESDTQKLVRKHLEDKDHVITEEEIANIRVGMTPVQPDEATAARFDEEAIEKAEDHIVGNDDKLPEGDNPKDNRATPWDAIQ